MESILISVIVPVYNVESYISKTIESILAQTYKNIEIILVDDGAKDNSGKICDEYAQKDNRIKVIHKENGGVSSARNCGIREMKGEYICFVDGDDWIAPNFIERLFKVINDNGADMSACSFFNTSSYDVTVMDLEADTEIITDRKFNCVFTEDSYAGYSCNKMFRSKIILENNILFDENIHSEEDMLFTIQYLEKCGKVAYIKERLYYYYNRPGSATTTVRLSSRSVSVLKAREKVIDIVKEVAPDCEDIVISSYLSHLIKVKYLLKDNNDFDEKFNKEINEKIDKYKKKILFLKNVSIKSRIKLFLMVYFPNIFGTVYRKIKVN